MGLRGVCGSGADEGVARAPGVALKCPQGQCAVCTWKPYTWCSFQSSVHIWISEVPYRVLAGQELASCFAKWGCFKVRITVTRFRLRSTESFCVEPGAGGFPET